MFFVMSSNPNIYCINKKNKEANKKFYYYTLTPFKLVLLVKCKFYNFIFFILRRTTNTLLTQCLLYFSERTLLLLSWLKKKGLCSSLLTVIYGFL